MNVLNVVRLIHVVQCSLFLYLFFFLRFACCTLLRIGPIITILSITIITVRAFQDEAT